MPSDTSDDPPVTPETQAGPPTDGDAFRRRIEARIAATRANRAAEDEGLRQRARDVRASIAADYQRRLADPVERAKIDAQSARIEAMLRSRQPRPLQPGEELRWFGSSAEAWAHLAGRSGYEIVKDGKVIERVVLVMN